jgi:ABC transport system ATP-binding/permease protein
MTATTSQARLVIEENSQSREVWLNLPALTLGRNSDNDLILAAPFISAYHARIESHGQGHKILDLGSTNGLLCEGQRVSEQLLHDGLVVRIGDPLGGALVTLSYHNPQAPARPAALQRLPLAGPRLIIGRSGGGAGLLLDSPLVSRQHALLEAHGGGWQITDLGSTNGVFVNGTALAGRVRLSAGDVVAVGPFALHFDGTALQWLSDPAALRLDAQALTRTVKVGQKSLAILNNVSLSILPREFVALVGGSGAGKSTLMKALSGFEPAEGQVLVNGSNYYRHFDAFRNNLGYVPQDDIVHGSLSVARALWYAARLRLPPDLGQQEIKGRIDGVLQSVEMTVHRDKIIEKLSGGQRKRVSIAVELLSEPNLLFLDEPTSGLDPGLEKRMMFLLRQLADQGRTVVLVTHATANIAQCDLVAFMAQGRLVYYGPPNKAVAFFGNPKGDFADVYSRLEEPESDIVARANEMGLQNEYQRWSSQNQAQKPAIAALWQTRFLASQQHQRFVADRLKPISQKLAATVPQKALRANPWRQWLILTERYGELIGRDWRNLAILLGQALAFAGFLLITAKSSALIMKGGPDVIASRGEGQTVLFVLVIASVLAGIVNSAREITKESAIYERERLVNLRVLPYLASKFVVLAAVGLLQSLLLLGGVALGLQFPAFAGLLLPPSLEMLITVFLSALGGTVLGLLVSALSPSPDRAMSIVPILIVPQIVFAGVIFKLDGLAALLSKLTVSHWGLGALAASINLNQFCADLPTGGECYNQDLYQHSSGHLLLHWGVLLGFIVLLLVITALKLKFLRQGKAAK